LPFYASYLPQTSDMKLVQAVYVTSVNGPCFSAVQKDAKYNSTIDINFGFETHPVFIPKSTP